jgi:ubiquitin-conjugating enzyme E2 variant
MRLVGTAAAFRRFEIVCIVFFPLAWLTLLARTWGSLGLSSFSLLALVTGILTADLISGVFHWFFDTWFSPDTPFIGRAFVRTFREHHVDPTAICRHDFVETNGSNIFAGHVLVIAGHLAGTAFSAASLLFAAVFMSLTSQIHKWAHAERVPRVVLLLQRARLILSKPAHALHHAAPFDRAYCITSGWLNGPLRGMRVFQLLERAITMVCGAEPRRDDVRVLSEGGDVDRDADVVMPAAQQRFVNERARDFGRVAVDAADHR